MRLVIGLVLILLLAGCAVQSGGSQTDATPTVTPTPAPSIIPKPNETPLGTPVPAPKKEGSENKFVVSVKEFELNKEIYSSKEDFNAHIVIESGSAVKDIEVRLSGIAVGSGAKIYRAVFTDLKKGENEFFLSQQTPSCTSGCGGVYPGKYNAAIQVLQGGEIIAEQVKEIELIQ